MQRKACIAIEGFLRIAGVHIDNGFYRFPVNFPANCAAGLNLYY